MTTHNRKRVARLLTLLTYLSLMSHAAAEPRLEDLVAAFEAFYQTPGELMTAREALRRRELQAQRASQPALSLQQRSAYTGGRHLTLDLDAEIVIPLFLARSEPEKAALQQRLVVYESEEQWTAMEARSNFQRDLLSTALLRELAHDISVVLESYRAQWHPPPSYEAADLLRLDPQQRELLALEKAVIDLQSFALDHLTELEARLQAALGSVGPISLPPYRSLLDDVGSTVPSESECMASSPARHQAQQRYEEQLLSKKLAKVLPFEVDLRATASRGFGPDQGGPLNNGRASLSLQARLPLPDGWPVGGGLDLSAGTYGIDQQLRLNWPPPIDFSPVSDVNSEPARRLADELTAIEADLRAKRDKLNRARVEIEESELKLLWFVRDVYGPNVNELGTARALAAAPFPDVLSELQATPLRAQLAFARLSEVEQTLALRLACGRP